jgi:hypothetical protein
MGVSATEIIQELPKLSPAERRTVRRVLSDLAAKEEDVQLCNQVATEAAMMFDRKEEEDARRNGPSGDQRQDLARRRIRQRLGKARHADHQMPQD